MRFTTVLAALGALSIGSIAWAQQPLPTPTTAPVPPTAPAQTMPAQPTAAADTKQALDLPQAADKLRDLGVPEKEVKDALKAARDQKLPAAEAGMVFTSLASMPMPQDRESLKHFGDAVEDNLEKGLRGEPLVTAVKTQLQNPEATEKSGGSTGSGQ